MKKPLYVFFISSCIISWSIWILLILSNKELLGIDIPRVTYFLSAIGPLIGALIATRFTNKVTVKYLFKKLFKFKVPFKWYLNSIIYPLLAYSISAALVFLLFSNPEYKFNSIINAFAIFFTIPFIVFGEEIGWRGFALTELQSKFSPIKSSLIIGLMWAIWHVPAFFVADIFNSFSQFFLAFIGFTILCMILSIIFTWVVNASGGSILMAVVMHSAIAASSSITNIALKDPEVFFSIFIAVFLIIAVLLVKKSGLLGLEVRNDIIINKYEESI